MQGQLELPFEWEPKSNEEVKLLVREKVAEHNSAKYEDDLTNLTESLEKSESLMESILDPLILSRLATKLESIKVRVV